MKYFKTLESYKWNISSYHKENERIYYFESEEWMYKVTISKNNNNSNFPYLGFRAKQENDFLFDMSVITNDNMYEVMKTIIDIIEYDYNTNNNIGYTFSLTGDKKNKREMLYRRLLKDYWDINYIEDENKFLIKKD